MHWHWLTQEASRSSGAVAASLCNIETRYRYNPDVKSLPAMVPAVIPILLMLIPAMLTALSVVREKELGSIINFYVTPVTRLEFLLGKQLPYVVLAMLNFLLLELVAVTLFGVPLKGSFFTLASGTLLYVGAATAMGLLISTFMRSQVAAIFGTAVLTILPGQPVLRHDRAGIFPGGNRCFDREALPDHLLLDHRARHVLEGPGLLRPASVFHPASDRRAGPARAFGCVPQEAGELSPCAPPTSCNSASRNFAASPATR
jgi:hypothetical protein